MGTLRWLLFIKLSDGVFRTLLLWLLQRWRIFESPKVCQHCKSPFTFQYHVASCARLRFRIVEEYPVVSLELEVVTYLPEAAVEHTVALIMGQTLCAPALSRSILAHIKSSIRASLELVFGPQTLAL